MPKWAVRISQFSKVGGTYLNTFDFTVDADTKTLAGPDCFKRTWNTGRINNRFTTDRQEFMHLQKRGMDISLLGRVLETL